MAKSKRSSIAPGLPACAPAALSSIASHVRIAIYRNGRYRGVVDAGDEFSFASAARFLGSAARPAEQVSANGEGVEDSQLPAEPAQLADPSLWLAARVDRGYNGWMASRAAYDDYLSWCRPQGLTTVNRTSFCRALSAAGLRGGRYRTAGDGRQARGWRGASLRSVEADLRLMPDPLEAARA